MASNFFNVTEMKSDDNVDPAGVISDNTQFYIDFYLKGVATILFAVFGVMANIINFIVFVKQRMRDCVSICLVALTVSDFGVSFLCLGYGICYITDIVNPGLYFDPIAFQLHLGWGRAMCYDISMLTTAFISLERCMCVVMPFKFKNVFNVRRSAHVLVFIYIFVVAAYMPAYVTQGFQWRFDSQYNKTRMMLWYAPHREEIQNFCRLLMHMSVTTFCQLVVIITTYFMVSELSKSTKILHAKARSSDVPATNQIRRSQGKDPDHVPTSMASTSTKLPGTKLSVTEQNGVSPSYGYASSSKRQIPILSRRNKAVSRMVSILAFIFIVSTFIRLGYVYTAQFYPDFGEGSRLRNLSNTYVGIVSFSIIANSSVNIFVYYALRPSFRAILFQTFCPWTRKSLIYQMQMTSFADYTTT